MRAKLAFISVAALIMVMVAAAPVSAQAVYEYDDNYHNYGWGVNDDWYEFSYREDDGCYWAWDWWWGWYYWCG